MKHDIKILMAALFAVLLSGSLASCSDDDFDATIFSTVDKPLDRTAYTFPLDTFVKVHFQEPYNMKYLYRMEDVGSDMDYNLVPCSYDKCTILAVLCEYLWYDAYKEVVSEEFLKKYSPRIIHVIGSPAYNPSSGTEVLGTAEGGLKITLYNGNNLSPSDIEYMNEMFFKTMHHEFSHILNQNVNRPTDFDLISNGRYNVTSWQDTPDSVALGQGFITPYGSSQAGEDWVEIIANYIVKDDNTWNRMLGAAEYDWEEVDYNVGDFDRAVATGADRDTLGYMIKVGSYSGGQPETYKVQRKRVVRDDTNTAVLNEEGKPTFTDDDGVNGRAVILQKLGMTRDWLKENFGYDLDKMRAEVQKRQWVTDENGDFVRDASGNYINKLTYRNADGTVLIDQLLGEIEKFKELQNK